MKKKILLSTLLVMLFVCLFAISVNAETALKPQNSNAYGELSIFDESITVGRTDTTNGYTPYKADGTSYARVVIGDGTTFYTFPTYYILSKNGGEDYGKIPLFQYDFTSLNAAMETATSTNPGWGIKNVYRIELPETMTRLNTSGTQKFYGFENVIEIYLPPNSTTIDKNANCLFHSCKNLTTIHNIETFVFKAGCTGGTFQSCSSLTSLTFGVSTDITSLGDNTFYGCTSLKSVNVIEAFPNLTILSGKGTFQDCKNLTTISSSRNDGVLVLPYTSYGQYVFQNCDSVKAIKFTASTINTVQQSFHSLDNLEYIYFPRTATLNLPSCEVFSNNEKLKAVAFPDNCTVIPDRGFKNCKALKAVYLPANLDELKTNGNDQGAFSSCYELYFVQEWFDVLDKDGEFLFEDFTMPTRPDVYFFPSNMTKFYTRDSGTGFYKNYKLNPVMVLPTTVTKLWVFDGCFYDCGEKGDTFTIVCLGDMADIRIGLRDNRAKGVSYVFANSADTSLSSVNIVDTNAGYTPNLNGTEFVYFCNGTNEKGNLFYLFNLGGSSDATQFTNDNVTWVNEVKHVQNPNGATSSDPTCTENQKTFKTCFCEAVFDIVEVENTATGHDLDYRKDGALATLVSVAYANGYHVEGVKVVCCGKCSENVEAEAEILFTGFGISTRIDNGSDVRGMVFSYRVNDLAIKEYNSMAQTALSYGVVATFAQVIGANNPLDNTGAPTLEKGVVSTNISNSEIYAVDLVIKGTKTLWEEEAYELDLYMLGYVVDENGVTYLGSVDGVSAASQNASDLKTVTYKDYYVTNEEVE